MSGIRPAEALPPWEVATLPVSARRVNSAPHPIIAANVRWDDPQADARMESVRADSHALRTASAVPRAQEMRCPMELAEMEPVEAENDAPLETSAVKK